MATRLTVLALALGLGVPAPALASPWTLPRGRLVVGLGYDYQQASGEFFGVDANEPRARRPFPLRGAYDASTVRLAARLGVLDELELTLSIPFRVVSYRSDPVLLLEQPADSTESAFDFYQQNVIDLSRVAVGVSDIAVSGRYRWSLSPIATATELRLRIPTGYRGPSGTFGDEPTSAEAFAADPARFISPANVTDDVTLGAGTLDIILRQHAGAAFRSGTFVRAEVAYALRFGGGGDQFLGALRAGQLLGERVLLYVNGDLALTVQRGRVIGVAVAAVDPTLPAEDYGGSTNLFLREVPLQFDALIVGGGLILRLLDDVELNAGYFQIVWGRNVAAIRGLSLTIAVQTELFSDEPS